MRTELTDNGVNVFVRQSWLKDATMCAERGRRAMVMPDWNTPNELTAFGTAVHAAIEHKILTPEASRSEMTDKAIAEFDAIADSGTMRWVRLQRHEIPELVVNAVNNWDTDIRPSITGDVIGVEQKFTYPMDAYTLADGRTVRIYGEGTIDLVTSEQLWDWKTASRRYRPTEKQKQDIQSTMYGGAAVARGWLSWPITFNFGVLVRDGGSQIVPVEREASHFEWLRRSIRPLVAMHLALGVEQEWPMNDTGFLCSETWCPFWSVCRGCHAQ